MAKPASYSVLTVKIRSFLDVPARAFLGRRIFTSVLTDDMLLDSVNSARKASGYKGVVSKNVARNAAAARRALNS
jgi:hypothetical protein